MKIIKRFVILFNLLLQQVVEIEPTVELVSLAVHELEHPNVTEIKLFEVNVELLLYILLL